MRVLGHLDPWALEAEMIDRIAAVKGEDPLSGVLVVVPTHLLREHVERRMAERLDACLAVEVLQYRQVVRSILGDGGEMLPRAAPDALLEAVLRRVLAGLRKNPIADFIERRPGATRPLLRTLRDLREAGLDPEEARRVLGGRRAAALARVYQAYVEAVESGWHRGLADEAALTARALPLAADWARRFSLVLHHGAYELIGIHLDLLRALARGTDLVFLTPIASGSKASAYAEIYAKRFLLEAGERLEAPDRRPGSHLGDRLRSLYDEKARPGEMENACVDLFHAQGPRAELAVALRGALAATAETPPREIALLAPSWSSYEAPLTCEIEMGEIPLSPPDGGPLRRHPGVRDFLLLLRAVAGGLPRGLTAELLRSTRVRWSALLDAGANGTFPGAQAETWSRKAGMLGGLVEWTSDLPDWAGRLQLGDGATEDERAQAERLARARHDEALRIGRALEVLVRRIDADTPRRWSDHASHLHCQFQELIESETSPAALRARDGFIDVLGIMDRIEREAGDARPVAFPEMLGWLESAVDDTRVEPNGSSSAGIAVLDAMQSRGLTFERIHLLGMNSGSFPAVPKEDPFLPDAWRAELSKRTGRPLSIKNEREREGHLLLALLLGAARKSLTLSWLRADDMGKAKSPSIAQREVARLLLGKPDAASLRQAAASIPAHPVHRIETLFERTHLLRRAEETLHVAAGGREAGETAHRLVARDPGIARGLRLVQAVESFSPAVLAYDARSSLSHVPPHPLSVSAFATLGRCPLQFFFRRVLRIEELEDEAEAESLATQEIGSRAHALLEEIYRELPEGLVLDPLRLRERVEGFFGEAGARRARRLPVLHAAERDRWLAALESFVREDLDRIRQDGLEPEGFEITRRATLDLGGGSAVTLTGRFDRLLVKDGKAVVGDYKTSGDLSTQVDVTSMLRGLSLQVPLYALLAGEGAAVELLGVGPCYETASERDRNPRRAIFEGFESPDHRAGFLETLRVLLELHARGTYPLRPDRHCGWCGYRLACRHTHAPTLDRNGVAPDVEAYRLLGKKTKKDQPTLALVRATLGPTGERSAG